ncbi:MAG: GntR family transcriptional regulator [Candidatus Caldatribacteriaceae bacterium]
MDRKIFVKEFMKERSIPLYQQLKSILKKQILDGVLKPGDRVPTEVELCKTYGVSQMTVRQAIRRLVEEGYLYRKQGKGTFVTSLKLRRRLPKLYSFSEDMVELGLQPSSKILEKTIIQADDNLADVLRLPFSDRSVNRLVRVRLANGEPILIEKTFIPVYLCPNLLQEDLETGSLYAILRGKYGLLLNHAYETYEVGKVRKEEAINLDCRPGLPAFVIERFTYLSNGVPVELTRSVARGDRLRFTVKLVADQAQIRREIEF